MRSLSFVLVVAGCSGQIGGGPSESEAGYAYKCSDTGQVLHGIDVSNYQGKSIDWNSVRNSGRSFAFAKASEGTGFTDGAFANNWPRMRAAGVVRGAYSFFHPGSDGAAQADLLVNVIDNSGGLADGDLAPVADVEVTDGVGAATVISRLRAFLQRLEARTGRRPIIYTGVSFWQDTLGNPDFSGYPLWIANYNGRPCPNLPTAWPRWDFWQYSDNDPIPGVPGGVDGDIFNGTIDQLHAFAGGGGSSPSSPVGGFAMGRGRAGVNSDGRLELFARAPDSHVWHDYQTSANGSWSGWQNLDGNVDSDPVIAKNADGRLEAFVIVGGSLWHRWQENPSSGWSPAWESLGDGNLVGEPTAALNTNGALEIFARSASGALEHVWQDSSGWSAWSSLGGVITSRPVAARNSDGRVEVFALGGDGKLWHIWQTAAHSAWSGWALLDGPALTGDPAVGPNADGRLEVFARASDGKLHHVVQLSSGQGISWSNWIDTGVVAAGLPAVGWNADGRLETFARGNDGALWHLWQTSANGSWTGGASLGGHLASDPDVGPNADGRLEAFWRASGGNVQTLFQKVGGGWSAVVDFGGNLSSF